MTNILVPNIEQVADYGSEQLWVARVAIGVPKIARSALDPKTGDTFADTFGPLYLELNYAFLAYRSLQGKLLKYERDKEYSNLYEHLWTAYKDRLPKVVKVLGFDIGFLFKKDTQFEAESLAYFASHNLPSDLRRMMKQDRRLWQQGLADFRNLYRQHQTVGPEIEKVWFTPRCAEVIFDSVWQAIEDIIVKLLDAKLQAESHGLMIWEIPEEDREPSCPERFRLGLSEVALKSLRDSIEGSSSSNS